MSATLEKPRRAKVVDAAELFEQRIRDGAYRLRGIPGERKLASDLGVSYMSARKVVGQLIAQRVLRRAASGRLVPGLAMVAKRGAQIAFVTPAFTSQTTMEIQYELAGLAAERGMDLRPVTYVQPSDPIIFEAIDGDFDGLFVILPTGAPQLLLDRLARDRERIVVLWQDLSHLGIPSIVTGPSRFIGKALDHLAGLGHRQVDCFNSLPHDPVVDDRIIHWRAGLEQRGMSGILHDEPTEPFRCSVTAAYQSFKRLIAAGEYASAYFCLTSELGRGAVRACYEAGLRVGRDISLCGFSEIGVSRLMVPSLTTVAEADATPFLLMGLEWITSGGKGWNRPLRLEPDDVKLFIGESTGPCPASIIGA